MGSGGVGGYFGARLVKGGADVHFVARGSHLAAMREHGLAVEGGPEAIRLPKVNVTDDPKTIGPVDMVMFCVKLWDTEGAARQLLPIMQPDTGVISFQNGVTKDDMLRPIFGDKALLGGVAYVGTSIGRPGVIAQQGPLQRLVFGEYDGRRSARAETFHEACKRGGINAELSDDVRRSLWEKFVVLVAMSGATTAMRQTIGPIRVEPADPRIPARSRPRGRGGRPRPWRQPARRLRRAAHSVLRPMAARDDHLDAPRPQRRQAARGALARRQRGRSRRAGGRADADEPRRARHPRCCTPRAAPPARRIERDA